MLTPFFFFDLLKFLSKHENFSLSLLFLIVLYSQQLNCVCVCATNEKKKGVGSVGSSLVKKKKKIFYFLLFATVLIRFLVHGTGSEHPPVWVSIFHIEKGVYKVSVFVSDIRYAFSFG